MKLNQSGKAVAFASIFMALVVSVSGCIQLGGGDEEKAKYGNGVIINSFQAFPSKVFGEESVELVVDIQNKGGQKANKIFAEIFSLGGIKNCDPSATKLLPFGSLDPTTEDFEGEIGSDSWECDSPSMPEGVETTINPKVRLYYNYSTSARTSIPVLERSEYKRKLRTDKKMSSSSPTTVSHGPFSVEIKSRSPAVVKKDGTEEEKSFRVTIHINNLISGTAYDPDSHPNEEGDDTPSSSDLDEIDVTISAPSSGSKIKCEDDTYSSSEDIPGENLRQGESTRIGCDLKVSSIRPQMSIPVEVNMNYGYFVTESTSVTVQGQSS